MTFATSAEHRRDRYQPRDGRFLKDSGIREGQVLLFVPGSTAALTTIEYERGVVRDLAEAVERIAPRGIPYRHDAAGATGTVIPTSGSLLGPSLPYPSLRVSSSWGHGSRSFCWISTTVRGSAGCRPGVRGVNCSRMRISRRNTGSRGQTGMMKRRGRQESRQGRTERRETMPFFEISELAVKPMLPASGPDDPRRSHDDFYWEVKAARPSRIIPIRTSRSRRSWRAPSR